MLSSIFLNVWSIFLIILFFGGSIFVHELGHFLAARKRGLKVERFSIGFGPKLLTWKKDGIEYCISLLPLGGYVALPQLADLGAIEGQSSKEKLPPICYTDKMIVSVMGAVFNVFFAFAIACILWLAGFPTAPQEQTTTVGYVEQSLSLGPATKVAGPAYAAGLQPGDKILAVDGSEVKKYSDIRKAIMMGSGRTEDDKPMATLTILRNSKEQTITLYPVLVPTNPLSGDYMRAIGIGPYEKLLVEAIIPNSPAQKAGLQAGDLILKANNTQLYSLRTLSQSLENNPKGPTLLTVERDGQETQISITPEWVPYTKPLVHITLPDKSYLELAPRYAEGMAFTQLSSPTSPSELYVLNTPDTQTYQDLFAAISYQDILQTANNTPIHSIQSLVDTLTKATASTLEFSTPEGETTHLVLPHNSQAELVPSQAQAMIGIQLNNTPVITHENPFTQFKNTIITTLQTLGSLINQNTDIRLQNLMGAPGIVRVLHTFSLIDLRLVLWFVVLLNINLAILNLLPIPVLDGGHMLFATIAKIRGKELPPRLIGNVQGMFMVLLFSLMIYVSFFDVRRWQGDSQSEETFEKQLSIYIAPSFSSTQDKHP